MEDRKYVKRRRVPRRDYNGLVGLLFRGQYEICRASQIGEGGMMIHTRTEMKNEDRIVLTFMLPGVDQTVVQSVVRFVTEDDEYSKRDGFKYGLEFLNLDFQAKRQIRSFVASKSESEFNLAS